MYANDVLKWQTSTLYDGEKTTVYPPDGGSTTTTADVAGRALSVARIPNIGAGGSAEVTSYTYDRVGRTTSITDPAGNQATFTYDRDGQLLTSTDPDHGTTTNTYDAGGRLASNLDAKNQKTSYRYDNLNRLVERWSGDVNIGTRQASYAWDSLAKGQLTSSTRYVGSDAYTVAVTGYTDAYLPTGQTWSIPMIRGPLAGTYTTNYTYDVAGNLSSRSYPAGGGLPAETVSYGYTRLGSPTTTSGLDHYVTASAYSNLNEIAQRVYGDPGAAQLTRQYTYEPATGRLANIKSLLPDQGNPGRFLTAQNDNYAYSPTGDVTKIVDGTDSQAQCYRYDSQHRLTDAWTAIDSCAANPTAAAIAGSGKYPYWDSYTFDSASRRTQDVHRASTATPITRTYTYPAAGATRTHAATSVAYTGATTRTDTMAYDPAGNTATRTINGVGTDFTFDNEGNFSGAIVHASGGDQTTNHLYDADGNLLIRTEPTGSTLYAAGQEYKAIGGTVTTTRYYTSGTATVCARTATSRKWLAADHQASASISVDTTSGAVQRRWYTSYGDDRAGQGTWPTDRGFLNKQLNPSTALIDLGAREYDPSLGTFLSPDPLQDPAHPTTFNAYAYANHSPITYSDPSGLRSCSGEADCNPGGAKFGDPDYEYCEGNPSCESGRTPPNLDRPVACKRNCGPSPKERARQQQERERQKAEAAAAAAKKILVDAALELGKVTADVLGITDAFNCFVNGDLGGCAQTALTVAASLVGGLAGKLVAKYWNRIDDAIRLVGRVKQLLGDLVTGVKDWLRESKAAKRLEETADAAETNWVDIDVNELTLSGKVASHTREFTRKGTPARPFNESRLTMQEIMRGSTPRPDPGGVPGGLRWDRPGALNGKEVPGNWLLTQEQKLYCTITSSQGRKCICMSSRDRRSRGAWTIARTNIASASRSRRHPL
ncbi:RHS repeat-associated core domain-containing protein [Dactylosporangium matsuzakiense]|uniref:RHS repeat-associated core domain-containing protein n=1 Tax=Dactylosporangium matsuzakiense TaxID=53360 RepID=UPI0022F348D4|nr:RHS repeat-associated core domain-containing protein [Dactylosporangium matsuzakiense]